jgi:ribosome biogenesis protein MAK21
MLKDVDEDDEMQDLADIDDEDLSDMEFNDSENEDVDNKLITDLKEKFKNGKKNPKNKEKKKGKGIDNNIFVSAEKFAEMLEEQGRTKRKHGSSHTFNINDGATDKQLDWEEKRHQQLKRGSFGKKRKRFVQSSNNKQFKKFRR